MVIGQSTREIYCKSAASSVVCEYTDDDGTVKTLKAYKSAKIDGYRQTCHVYKGKEGKLKKTGKSCGWQPKTPSLNYRVLRHWRCWCSPTNWNILEICL